MVLGFAWISEEEWWDAMKKVVATEMSDSGW